VNGKRCAIRLGEMEIPRVQPAPFMVTKYIAPWGTTSTKDCARIFGSHSEAKRELAKWLPGWPNAKIVDEVEL
jgi:hypothetical protein